MTLEKLTYSQGTLDHSMNQGKIAFGENAGNYVTRIGSGFGYAEEVPKF